MELALLLILALMSVPAPPVGVTTCLIAMDETLKDRDARCRKEEVAKRVIAGTDPTLDFRAAGSPK